MLSNSIHKLVTITTLTRLTDAVSVFVLLWVQLFVLTSPAFALSLTDKQVEIGNSAVSASTSHAFEFTVSTSASVGSLVLEYCSNLPFYGAACTVPTGLDVSSSNFTSQSGVTGLSVDPLTNNNRLVATRAPSAVAASTAASFTLNNIINQDFLGSVYVRISTHSSIDGTGLPIDFGAVVYSTARDFTVGGYVPPYLTFCVGVTVASNCSSTTSGLLDLGEFSTSTPSFITSQFAGATNVLTGYNVYISGGTFTAGNSIIPPLTSNSSSSTGVSQFGINLRNNSSPNVGANVQGIGVAAPATNYGSANSYRYVNGERIAFASEPTNYNTFTVSYVVNVSEDQEPGVYASSYTYTAIAAF